MIEIKNLNKSYRNILAVNNLSLEIKPGMIFGFLGPNGAGKTTTIKILVGLTRPDSGTVSIGRPTSGNPSIKDKEFIGYMPENPYFYEYLSGLEFLQFCGQLFEKSYTRTKEEYLQLLRSVDLLPAGHLKVRTYSKGMRQRLGFAQAIVNDPQYVFLDEPLDGLDPLGRREVKKLIKGLRDKGKTVFFNSHILSDVEEICDEIGVIHQGRLIYSGSVKNFTKEKPLEEQFVTTIEKIGTAVYPN